MVILLLSQNFTASHMIPKIERWIVGASDSGKQQVVGATNICIVLFRKPRVWGDGGLVSQRIILPELDFRFLLY